MLLNYPLKSNKLADDMESFYHLLVILALRYHDHNKNSQEIKTILEEYDQCEYRYGYWVGGTTKLDNVSDGRIPFKLRHEDTFTRLLVSLAELLKQHYASKDRKVLEQRYGIPELPSLAKRPEATSPASAILPATSDADAFVEEEADDEFAAFATVDSGVQLTVLKKQPAPERPVSPLKNHSQFLALLSQAIRDKDWTPGDKGIDKFALIDWTATRDNIRVRSGSSSTAKRTYSSTLAADSVSRPSLEQVPEEEPPVKKPKTTMITVSRQTRSASYVQSSGPFPSS